MQNLVTSEVVKTIQTGTIEGKNVTINFENKPGELPNRVTAICSIPDAANPMQGTNINVSVSIMGSKTISVEGVVVTGNLTLLLHGIEKSIQAVLTSPTV